MQPAKKYRTMTEIVTDELRFKILNGDFTPGQRLVAAEIADEMGFSRMPVRDALRNLESTGLVETYPHRGTVVKDLSAEEIVEIYHIRAVLEGLASRMACTHMTPEQEEDLDRLMETYDVSATGNEDYEGFTSFNRQFHSLIWSFSGSARLVTLLSNLYDSCSQYRNLSYIVPGRPLSIINEHLALYQAVKSRDCDEAERVARRHYENSSIALLSAIEHRKSHSQGNAQLSARNRAGLEGQLARAEEDAVSEG